jgi:hypothetical protein
MLPAEERSRRREQEGENKEERARGREQEGESKEERARGRKEWKKGDF